MRLTVNRVVELAALYPNREELLREYPELACSHVCSETKRILKRMKT
jgi:uncharacterized protein (DUF433 family)